MAPITYQEKLRGNGIASCDAVVDEGGRAVQDLEPGKSCWREELQHRMGCVGDPQEALRRRTFVERSCSEQGAPLDQQPDPYARDVETQRTVDLAAELTYFKYGWGRDVARDVVRLICFDRVTARKQKRKNLEEQPRYLEYGGGLAKRAKVDAGNGIFPSGPDSQKHGLRGRNAVLTDLSVPIPSSQLQSDAELVRPTRSNLVSGSQRNCPRERHGGVDLIPSMADAVTSHIRDNVASPLFRVDHRSGVRRTTLYIPVDTTYAGFKALLENHWQLAPGDEWRYKPRHATVGERSKPLVSETDFTAMLEIDPHTGVRLRILTDVNNPPPPGPARLLAGRCSY